MKWTLEIKNAAYTIKHYFWLTPSETDASSEYPLNLFVYVHYCVFSCKVQNDRLLCLRFHNLFCTESLAPILSKITRVLNDLLTAIYLYIRDIHVRIESKSEAQPKKKQHTKQARTRRFVNKTKQIQKKTKECIHTWTNNKNAWWATPLKGA